MTTSERREYFRINDRVGLSYKIIRDPSDEDPYAGEVEPSLHDVIADIDRQFNQASNTIWQENPTIAQAFGLLNRKLAILTALVLPEEKAGSFTDTEVNISGGGLGFPCSEELPADTRLEMTLTLRPSNIHLELTAHVTDCQRLADNIDKPYWVRVNFEPGNEAAQEQLIQHIVQRQSAQLVKHRE